MIKEIFKMSDIDKAKKQKPLTATEQAEMDSAFAELQALQKNVTTLRERASSPYKYRSTKVPFTTTIANFFARFKKQG
jgi:hypothetical protein